ncbi:MAG: DUF1501 domain-containing protein [Pseudobdellovibrionaceae bacterium]|nr:MAG: DUF1501 domain-containing protein [Pseudobdellovibrionaceae bacterium]
MSKKQKLTRRELLEHSMALGLMTSPVAMIFDSIISGMVQKALAESSGVLPRRYVSVQLFGAPPRWMYDLFLNPYGDPATFDPKNANLGTRYTESGGRLTNTVYETAKIKGINAPFLWKYDVAKRGGGTRPMRDLLDNMLALQGINCGNPDHSGAAALHFRPLGASVTQPAMVADRSAALIPAVNVDADMYSFLSLANKSPVQLMAKENGGNLVKTLLDPFTVDPENKARKQAARVQDLVDGAVSALDAQLAERHPAGKALNVSRKSAGEMFKQVTGDLDAVWAEKKAPYLDLVNRTLHQSEPIPFINDKPIGVVGERNNHYQLATGGGSGEVVAHDDIRDLMRPTTRILNIVEHFAVAEYILENDLSHSVVISPRNFAGINFTRLNPIFDEHSTGKMPSLYLNSMYYRALSACLLGFIDRLKDKGIFNETVVEVFSEFNRNPKNVPGGSDHGWEGKSVVYYSGAIQGPLVVGNLLKDSGDVLHPGAWGKGASTNTATGKPLGQLNLGHQVSTLATLLRVPTPVTAASSLISPNPDATVTSDDLYVEKTKVV